jgi:hypothetical protein
MFEATEATDLVAERLGCMVWEQVAGYLWHSELSSNTSSAGDWDGSPTLIATGHTRPSSRTPPSYGPEWQLSGTCRGSSVASHASSLGTAVYCLSALLCLRTHFLQPTQ